MQLMADLPQYWSKDPHTFHVGRRYHKIVNNAEYPNLTHDYTVASVVFVKDAVEVITYNGLVARYPLAHLAYVTCDVAGA